MGSSSTTVRASKGQQQLDLFQEMPTGVLYAAVSEVRFGYVNHMCALHLSLGAIGWGMPCLTLVVLENR